jgi:Kef-type K+ transport system membrane component KefB
LFFAFTGLRTSISLLSSGPLWLYCLIIIVIAVIGKFGGATLSARAFGMSWREAGALGALMNTRGLIELVVLNIGLEIGVLSPTVFTMMVLMALTTTFTTTPLLDRIYPPALRQADSTHAPIPVPTLSPKETAAVTNR